MLKAERLETESKVFVMDTPVVGKIKKFPLAAALFAAVIVCVGTLMYRGLHSPPIDQQSTLRITFPFYIYKIYKR